VAGGEGGVVVAGKHRGRGGTGGCRARGERGVCMLVAARSRVEGETSNLSGRRDWGAGSCCELLLLLNARGGRPDSLVVFLYLLELVPCVVV
jgi:hypothetical protein